MGFFSNAISAVTERRKDTREVTNKPAWIEGARGRLIPCVITNISKGGAQIDLDQHIILPRQFALWMTKDGKTKRECGVVWRQPSDLGVRFLDRE
jgi:PilZ domain